MEKSDILKPALIGGIVMGLVYAIPGANCLCCLIAIGGGMLAAYFYIKESPVVVRSGDGALVGVLSGTIGSIVSTIISIPLSLLFGPMVTRLSKGVLLDLIKGLPNVPPEALSRLENLPEHGISIIGMIMRFIFALLILSTFGTIGGIIGVSVFEKRSGSEPYVPPPPPPPPTTPGPVNLPPQSPPEPPATGP